MCEGWEEAGLETGSHWGPGASLQPVRQQIVYVRKRVASWICVLEGPVWLLPGGGVGSGPEAGSSSLTTKLLLSSEKVLDALCPALLAAVLPEASTSTQGSHRGNYTKLPGEPQGGTPGGPSSWALHYASLVHGRFTSCPFAFKFSFEPCVMKQAPFHWLPGDSEQDLPRSVD